MQFVYPRINLHLKISDIISYIFNFNKSKYIENSKEITNNLFDDKFIYTGQLRIGFYLVLDYLKNKHPNKLEVLISPLNIFPMINIIYKCGLKPVFIDNNINNISLNIEDLQNKITDRTLCCVLTNHYSNVQNDKILALLNQKKIYSIEDCATTFLNFYPQSNVISGTNSDFALYSFGFYKSVNCMYGGGIYAKNLQDKNIINQNKNYKIIKKNKLLKQLFFFLAYKFLTNKYIYLFFTFQIIKFGILNNISTIKNFTKNDPKPFKSSTIKQNELFDMSTFQYYLFFKGFNRLEKIKKERFQVFLEYDRIFSKYTDFFYIPKVVKNNFYQNYPIIIKKNKFSRSKFYNYLIKNNFDLAIYFYRNCSTLKCFKGEIKCENSEYISSNILIFPCYKNIEYNLKYKLSYLINNFIENQK